MTTSALLAVLVAASAPQEAPVFATEVGVVRVEARVTRKGASVPGLSASDFELRDNGVVQEPQLAFPEDAPVDVVLALDLSGSVRGARLDALKTAARTFLGGLHGDEQAALIAFRDEVRLLEPFGGDRARLRRTLDAAEPRGGTSLRDAVYAALRLRAPGPRRTAVVVFSDGLDNLSVLDAAEVVAAAAHSEAVVYGVGVRRRGDPRQAFLGDVVQATGGRLFEVRSERDLQARFADVLSEIRSRYVLSFTPAGAPAPGWHALEVRLKRRKADVVARPGYWR